MIFIPSLIRRSAAISLTLICLVAPTGSARADRDISISGIYDKDYKGHCQRACAAAGLTYKSFSHARAVVRATCHCGNAIPAQAAQVCALEAGPIWNGEDAKTKCAVVCKAPATWNGAWRTTVADKMSTCDCATTGAPSGRVCALEVGPIWNGEDAKAKCAAVCKPPAKWNGAWRTTVAGAMSTCDCANP